MWIQSSDRFILLHFLPSRVPNTHTNTHTYTHTKPLSLFFFSCSPPPVVSLSHHHLHRAIGIMFLVWIAFLNGNAYTIRSSLMYTRMSVGSNKAVQGRRCDNDAAAMHLLGEDEDEGRGLKTMIAIRNKRNEEKGSRSLSLSPRTKNVFVAGAFFCMSFQ